MRAYSSLRGRSCHISIKQTLFASIFLLLVHPLVFAQSDALTPLGLKAGTPSETYALTDIDTVNLFNGQVNLRLGLISEAGRGQARSQMNFTWDSPMRYQVYKSSDPNGNPTYGVGGGTTNADGSVSYGFHTGEYSVFPLGVFSDDGSANWCSEGLYVWSGKTLTRFYWTEPEGTQHEMRDVLTNGQPLANGGCWSAGPNRGKVFVSTDGSGATFVADNAVRDGIYVGMEFPVGFDWDGWLFLKDGRRIRISWNNNRGVRDRNGNLLLSRPGIPYPIIDNLNRTITQGTGTSTECNAIIAGSNNCGYWAYKGYGGTERRIYTFWEPDGFRAVLPNGTSYRFYFNFYQDLTRIDLPTGGSIEYDYGPGLSGPQPNMSWISGNMPGVYVGGPSDFHVYRRVTERRVYKEGHVLDSRQTFSTPEDVYLNNAGYVDKANYDGNSNLISTERHYFYGGAERSFWLQPTQYSSWKDGREYRSEIYDATGTLLRTINTSWEQRAPVAWWTGSSDEAPSNDPRVTAVTTVMENGAQYTNSYNYDPNVPYNSLVEVIERDFNSNILRRKQTTYLKTLNAVDYAGLNVQTASALHMRDFPLQESIFGFGGVLEEARTTYEYDNYTADSNHAPLIPRPNISGFDAAFSTTYLTRGNVTGTTRYLLTNGTVTGSVTSYAQYDVAGNVVKTIDPRGNAITVDFTDRYGSPNAEARTNSSPTELSTPGQFSYAFPTFITNAMNHTTYAQIDYYTGQAVDVEDANGLVSSMYFNDPLERSKQIIVAANNVSLKMQTSYAYDDVTRKVTTTSDLIAYQDNLKKGEAYFDGLGRPVESRVYESASNYMVTKTIFSGLTTQTSNPYRPWQNETAIWTTTVVDALGRTKTVTTPDSAVITTSYVGNQETVTDQTGKKRKTVSDSLGRVADVYEDPTGLNYRTIYGYNALGKLISVNQDTASQPIRNFGYDSLGRLLSATNPESGTVTFMYDEASNLLVKTDARGVSTHTSYDALNRPTRRWYNGSSATLQLHTTILLCRQASIRLMKEIISTMPKRCRPAHRLSHVDRQSARSWR